jgi:hypothetical protein
MSRKRERSRILATGAWGVMLTTLVVRILLGLNLAVRSVLPEVSICSAAKSENSLRRV